MKKTGILMVLLVSSFAGIAQTTDPWTYYKDKFSDEPAIIISRSEVLNILIDGDSLRAYTENSEDMLHLKEQSDVFSGRKVYGSHFNKISGLTARTLIWDKSRYKEMNVTSFKKNTDPSSGVFFDDQYYYSFNFPAIASRNRTQLEYREDIKDARFISGYVFSSYLPQGKTMFTIKAPKDVEIGYMVFNDDAGILKYSRSEKGNTVTYEWSAENLPGIKVESDGPELRYYAPHVVCYVKSYLTKKGKKINMFSNLDDLHAWYYTFIQDLNKTPSPELAAIVADIKSKSQSELDVVKNIFYWVQDNIKYIAFEQGMRGFIPHPASYTCEKRYGDCKDMANIIVGMLHAAGIKAYHTWIGSRDLPYRYSVIPTPMVDNHMIATYISKDGKYYFLDATSDYTPFGFPSSMIQGKEALISFDASHYEIKEVPIIAPNENLMSDSVSVTLQNNQLTGTGKSSLTGYVKILGAYEMDRTEPEDVKKSVVRLLGKGSNKFFLDKYKITHLQDRDTPTRIAYEFRVADYFQKAGDEIYVNLNLSKDYYNDFINTATRKTPKEAKYKYTSSDVISLAIPEGYDVEYLPENIRYEGNLVAFDIRYTKTAETITLVRKISLKYLLMGTSDFGSWNQSIKKLSAVYKESVILKHK